MPTDDLSRYHAKRDFKITPEPRGRVNTGTKKALSYLIQKHAASHLHYDFRLELNGVLLSWAVPKGPSLDPADKRLAMHVEDHPLEYGQFEGTIPQGQYGGGTVMLWDRGTWSPVGDPVAGYKKGHLKFDLNGEKLQGRWALIKTSGGKFGGKGEPWLLVKDRDAHAKREGAPIVVTQADSVTSGRTITQIAAANDHEWHSNRSVKANVKSGAVKLKAKPTKTKSGKPPKTGEELSTWLGARAAKLPSSLSPALATLVDAAPQGEKWIQEVKFDGYRMLCRLQSGKAHIFSRNGKDWTAKFAALAAEFTKLQASEVWIDGELCAVDTQGHSNFQALQHALGEDDTQANIVYFAFDLLYLDGYDLREVPLLERKGLLEYLLLRSQTALRFSPHVRGSGPDVFKQACQMGLEGIISKRANSTYATGLRTRDWIKVKCLHRQEMVIGGYTEPSGGRTGFGALLLGVYENGKLQYSGKVGTGFTDVSLKQIRKTLDQLKRDSSPFVNPPTGFQAKGVHWIKPMLVAEIKFTEWSEGGALRHPAFVAIREDKKASDVVRETPEVAPRALKSPRKEEGMTMAKAETSSDSLAGVKLTHADKKLFPEADLTKLDLAKYYEDIAEWILPEIKNRPLSLLRCPDGWGKECFYQKHAEQSANPSVTRVEVPESDGRATYLAANSLAALVSLVQWGVIELHPWGSRMPKPERPDRLIFDFDPADDVPWPRIVEAVKMLKTLLESFKLSCFLKTTGGKGLHVVVPIKATLTWQQAKSFTKSIAELFAHTFPEQFTATSTKAKRPGKIYIDYLRNAEGATAIAAYGIRARKNAPVSTPIAWGELSKDLRFDFFNVRNVPQRLARLKKDPWEGFEKARRTVTVAVLAKVGVIKAAV